MERGFGISLAGVRLHTDAISAQRASREGAVAFTAGQQVFFGAGAYQPGHLTGDALLAHELAHTIQQRGGGAALGSELSEHQAQVASARVLARAHGLGAPPAMAGLGQGGPALRRCAEVKPDRITELKKKRASLGAIIAAPTTTPYGELAAAMTEDTLVAHQLKQLETGRGTLAGNLSGEAPAAGITQSDCTILVLDILERAFTAQGRGADWKKVRAEAYKLAGSGKLSGLHIQKALVSEAGWKGIFWAPNPRFAYTSAGDEAEHASAYKEVREKQTYKGLPVGPTVIDYRPGPGSKTTQSLEGIERLRKIPFGVLSARGATHMALVVRGAVIEVHWKETSDKPNVIEGTPLEKWGWLSGAIVAPAEDVDAAFPPPAR
jgi:hypothetical protein